MSVPKRLIDAKKITEKLFISLRRTSKYWLTRLFLIASISSLIDIDVLYEDVHTILCTSPTLYK